MTTESSRVYAWAVVDVTPNYPTVDVVFADGTRHVFDLEHLFDRGPAFEPLRSPEFFNQVGIVDSALTWPNGTDIAPDWMYEQATGRSGWRTSPAKE